ncbi:N-lysine methyltransferase SETD6 isoform X3 [Sapajus apella]|uniref:N-lysine methyltransferase SETD6 n=2 Tax=Cebinae TaxID=38070 RepID=A0A6J3ICM2_SAPAP|nr:N-lysine methyltransferase SETD6 isoform X3 [Sapajus apella]
MFSGGTIPAGANRGRSTARTPKQAPRGSGAGAGPETPEVIALPTGPRGGSRSDHGDPGKASTARSAHAPRSPLFLSGPSGAGPGHCAHLSQVAGPMACGNPDPVAGFLSWCRRVGLELSPKVEVSRQGTVAGYGMMARESVQAGELLFVVPRAAILSQHTCSIGGLLERERGALQSQSGWVPLLLALLHELQAAASHWRPYFALWPELGHLEHPMFCFQEPLEEEEDEKEPNSPMMVPAADILNHLANHNANLEYSADCLRMVATQPIPKGHEIFNTYGQMANWQLIHMYGFVEPYPDNTDDTADIQMVTVREAALQGTKTEAERLLMYERWDFLCKLEMVGEEGAFVIGREEVLTEEELTTTLKVLCMPAEEFREFKDQDGGGDDKREDGSLAINNIPKLKASWRQLLRNSILLTLQTYATDLKTDKDVLSNKEVYAKLSRREQQALQVRYGQKMILHQLLELTS